VGAVRSGGYVDYTYGRLGSNRTGRPFSPPISRSRKRRRASQCPETKPERDSSLRSERHCDECSRSLLNRGLAFQSQHPARSPSLSARRLGVEEGDHVPVINRRAFAMHADKL